MSRWRFGFLLFMVGACFATVLVQLWWLHVMSAPHLRAEAYRARLIYREKAASRGQIVDSRGTLLAATTREVWDIVVDAHALSESERKQSGEVARILGIDVENVEKAFTKSYREPKKNAPKPANGTDATPAPVAALKPVPATAPAKLPPVFFRAIYEKYFKSPVVAAAEDAAAPDEAVPVPIRGTPLANGVEEPVLRQIEKLKIKGIYGNRRFIREYPKGRLASHLIGYLDRAGKAQMGVEKSMDWFLVGQRGSVLSKRDGKRTELPEQRQREIEPVDGQRIELTIDSFVQEVCETEATRAAAEYHPKSVIIIVSEAATGKLLGLANWPDFDLREPGKVQADVVNFWPDYDSKKPSKAQESARRNRAIADIYDPGSAFKIVPICMGLNEGIVT
ncbi:MAG: hypothetical protein LBV28_03425, partial [Puniceicoccales bacterium]|nr:hypothetical protein [Puniceicoccales bacterium]